MWNDRHNNARAYVLGLLFSHCPLLLPGLLNVFVLQKALRLWGIKWWYFTSISTKCSKVCNGDVARLAMSVKAGWHWYTEN
jgi:hypothetical protein